MIDILKRNNDKSFDIVSKQQVSTGDKFICGHDKDNKPIYHVIETIFEQRKERGTYEDESKQRFWAKVA